ncbi:MAG: tRNA (adenosine(37)-N6)-threonylcarbamoyltransferase complex dimerization subunit type 1 TsaB [Clostridiales bacterium]|nr:tRNA (adenosine(37)-N6)-threonylcarbamoyltransferase complex dimerization subunit type 1 TsaB [Clostridiales bacterium]
MKLLAFETTDKTASVALLNGSELFVQFAPSHLRHAESVLPEAEALLTKHGLTTADMDAFAVDVGPGSFTGVRIGVCLANGLAAWHDKPVISVNALETLAYPYREQGHPVLALIDARNGNGYAAMYDGEKILLEPCACIMAEALAQLPDGGLCVGSGALPARHCGLDSQSLPNAGDVALLAANRAGDIEATPLYLRPSQAERLWKEKL